MQERSDKNTNCLCGKRLPPAKLCWWCPTRNIVVPPPIKIDPYKKKPFWMKKYNK